MKSTCGTTKKSAALLISIFITVSIDASGALALDYKQEMAQAQRLDIDREYRKELGHLLNAQKLIAPGLVSERLELLCQIGLTYGRLANYGEMFKTMDAVMKLVEQNGGRSGISPEAMYSLAALLEVIDQRATMSSLSNAERLSLLKKGDVFCRATLPHLYNLNRFSTTSRLMIAVGYKDESLKYSERMVRSFNGKDREYIELRIAVLKKVLGNGAHYDSLRKALAARYKPLELACELASAQTWGVDYDGCVVTLKEARQAMEKSRTLDAKAKIALTETELHNEKDRANYRRIEPLCKQMLALPIDDHKRAIIRGDLINCYLATGRPALAKAMQGKTTTVGAYDFIADEERDALAEIAKRKAGKKPQ